MSGDKPLTGLVFSIAGQLSRARSNYEVQSVIVENGANFQASVTRGVTHVISSLEMIEMLDIPYKLQFFPGLEQNLNEAKRLNIPVVDESFLDKCLKADRKVDEAPFLIEGTVFQQSKKQRTKEETNSHFSFDSPFFRQAQETAPSKLDERVQELIQLLFDRNQMERALTNLGLNAKKCMDSVSENDILNSYTVLQKLDNEIQLKQSNKSNDNSKIQQLSQEFYRLIPHLETPTIGSLDVLKMKMSMLEALNDIVIAAQLMRGEAAGALAADGSKLNPIDLNYAKLKTKLEPLEKYSQEFDMITQYVKNTHAKSHENFVMEVKEVFVVERQNEGEKFKPFKRLPHHRLLWHGSRLTNFIGILSEGLRIAPKEAPSTGYFLGKGIYFADMVSKSAEYCHANDFKDTGLMLLCDVALGRPFQVAHGKFISKEDLEQAGFHSTKGVGEKAPDPTCDLLTSDGLIVPLGRETDVGIIMSELEHNEYIVYDPAQVNVKYLVKLQFTYKAKTIH